jgi:predicted RNA binding protein YcfA (HicA-like mRNA interferase family)
MPPKIRDLLSDRERAGFVDRGGKGSHRNFTHPKLAKPVTVAGKAGEDAKPYQVKQIRKAIEEAGK